LTSSSLADFVGGGAFLKLSIYFSTSSLIEASSSASVFSYDRGDRSLLNGDEIVFFCCTCALLDCDEVVFFCDVIFLGCEVVLLGGDRADFGGGGAICCCGGGGAIIGGGGGGADCCCGGGDIGHCCGGGGAIGRCCSGGDDTGYCYGGGGDRGCCCGSDESELEDSESSSSNSMSCLHHRM
jgi:hypothetical protein